MLKKIFGIALIVALSIYPAFAGGKKQKALNEYDKEIMVVETDLGNIVIALFPSAAPKHVKQFKTLAGQDFYNGTLFHRVVPGFVIQGGDPMSKQPNKNLWGTGNSSLPNIPAEFNKLSHTRGRVGAARGGDPDSANCQFYICVSDTPFLDGKYTVVGEVIKGMEIVDAIVNVPADTGSRPLKNITMKKVYLTPAKP